jgi:Astacin (Peptidase family M12A)
MKKTKFSVVAFSTALIMGFASCEKNEVVETPQDSIAIIDEIYNPTSTGKVIDAVYNGNDVKLLEIENGKYLFDGDVVLERNDFSLPGEITGKGVYSGGNWPSRTVRWRYDSGVSQDLKNKWATATTAWNNDLGFIFTNITVNTGDYILVQQNSNGSAYSTSIGRRGGQQIISVDPRSFSSGSVIHEIGYVVGLIHEQKRPDRKII